MKPNASVAMNVVWYAHADTKNHPVAGIVIGGNGQGIVDLQLFSRNGGAIMTGVRHVSETEFFQEHFDVKCEKGGWDFAKVITTCQEPKKIANYPNSIPLQDLDDKEPTPKAKVSSK